MTQYFTENENVWTEKKKVAWKMTNRFQWKETIKGRDLKAEEKLIPYWMCAWRGTLEFSSELHIQMPVSRLSIFRRFYIRPQESFTDGFEICEEGFISM